MGKGSLIENVTTIFGKKQASGLQLYDYFDSNHGVRISGALSKGTMGCGRGQADRQFMYLHGRPVELPRFTRVLNEAYRRVNPHQLPFAILDITLPNGSYDVNVTPDKRKIFVHGEREILEQWKEHLVKQYDVDSVTMVENPYRQSSLDYQVEISLHSKRTDSESLQSAPNDRGRERKGVDDQGRSIVEEGRKRKENWERNDEEAKKTKHSTIVQQSDHSCSHESMISQSRKRRRMNEGEAMKEEEDCEEEEEEREVDEEVDEEEEKAGEERVDSDMQLSFESEVMPSRTLAWAAEESEVVDCKGQDELPQVKRGVKGEKGERDKKEMGVETEDRKKETGSSLLIQSPSLRSVERKSSPFERFQFDLKKRKREKEAESTSSMERSVLVVKRRKLSRDGVDIDRSKQSEMDMVTEEDRNGSDIPRDIVVESITTEEDGENFIEELEEEEEKEEDEGRVQRVQRKSNDSAISRESEAEVQKSQPSIFTSSLRSPTGTTTLARKTAALKERLLSKKTDASSWLAEIKERDALIQKRKRERERQASEESLGSREFYLERESSTVVGEESKEGVDQEDDSSAHVITTEIVYDGCVPNKQRNVDYDEDDNAVEEANPSGQLNDISVSFDWEKFKSTFSERRGREEKKRREEEEGRKKKQRFLLRMGDGEEAEVQKEMERKFDRSDFGRLQVLGQFNLGFLICKVCGNTQVFSFSMLDIFLSTSPVRTISLS